MAPKQQAVLVVPDAAAPPAPAPPHRPPKGLTAARFYSSVAAACEEKITVAQVRMLLAAVREVVAADFQRGVRQTAVPQLCRLRVRMLAARGSSQKIVFGKPVDIRARDQRLVLKATPSKVLKDRLTPPGAAAAA